MWHWTCPKDPKLIYEHHSYELLNESLTAHELGCDIPSFRSFPSCQEIHEFWDDGNPCDVPNCKFEYVPDTEPWSYVDSATLN